MDAFGLFGIHDRDHLTPKHRTISLLRILNFVLIL
jgi:hypothetical protein